jgi:hypothetical protein
VNLWPELSEGGSFARLARGEQLTGRIVRVCCSFGDNQFYDVEFPSPLRKVNFNGFGEPNTIAAIRRAPRASGSTRTSSDSTSVT